MVYIREYVISLSWNNRQGRICYIPSQKVNLFRKTLPILNMWLTRKRERYDYFTFSQSLSETLQNRKPQGKQWIFTRIDRLCRKSRGVLRLKQESLLNIGLFVCLFSFLLIKVDWIPVLKWFFQCHVVDYLKIHPKRLRSSVHDRKTLSLFP